VKTIDVNTKLVGLLGYPLKQSFSPAMQNRAFEVAGLNYYYFPIEIDTAHLKDVLNAIRWMNFAGCNVTKPNKIEVLQYLDKVDPSASAIGAVNTIKNVDGQLTGYNTDGLGFAEFLEQDQHVDIKKTHFFVLGCGGAGRAIVTVLADRGARSLTLTDMSEAAALNLVDSVRKHTKGSISMAQVGLGSDEMARALEQADVVINATAVGMNPYEADTPLAAKFLDKRMLVCDIIYNPIKTRLMKEAESVGCRTANGLGMVIYQGAAAFSIWTNQQAPVDTMSSVIYDLAGKSLTK
jgi:shikimate dehydrogenase